MTSLFQHINIEQIIRYMFMGLIALPLPLLLFHGLITSIFEEARNIERFRSVKKRYDNIDLVTLLQLQQIYPNKNMEMLEDILETLIDRSHKVTEQRLNKISEKAIGIIQKLQPEKVQIYPVIPAIAFNS